MRSAALALAVAIGLGGLATSVSAQTVRVFANSAHQIAFEGQDGGGLQQAFEEETGLRIVWETVPYPQMRQTLLRALSSGSSQYDVVMIENAWAVPTVLESLLPISSVAGADQMGVVEAVFPSMLEDFALDGEVMGVPIRSNPQIVHYNTQLFADRDVAVPQTFEELLDAAEQVSHTRDDGAQVYGLALKPNEDLIAIVKALGGDVLSSDFEVQVQSPETIAAVERIKELFEAGAIPPNFFTMDASSVQTLMREGLAAMTFFGDNYYLRFNDPESSRIAGDSGFFALPGQEAGTYAPAKVAFWAAALPQNASEESRQNGWAFINYLASAPVQLQMAMNGNGPVSAQTLEDPAFIAQAPYAEVSAIALENASPLLPVFDGTAQIQDAFQNAVVAAVIGNVSVEDAMAGVAADIEDILASRR